MSFYEVIECNQHRVFLSAVSGIFDNHQLFGCRFGQRFDYFPAHPDGSAEIVLAYDQEQRFFEFRSDMYGHQFGRKIIRNQQFIAGLVFVLHDQRDEIVEIRRKGTADESIHQIVGVCRNHGQIGACRPADDGRRSVQNFLLFGGLPYDSPVIFQHFRITQVVAIHCKG